MYMNYKTSRYLRNVAVARKDISKRTVIIPLESVLAVTMGLCVLPRERNVRQHRNFSQLLKNK